MHSSRICELGDNDRRLSAIALPLVDGGAPPALVTDKSWGTRIEFPIYGYVQKVKF
jgi:hypothetical protein